MGLVGCFKKLFNIKDNRSDNMISDEELWVILQSFYRRTDGVIIPVIVAELKKYGINRKGVVTEAIEEGILKKITKIRVVLTGEGREMWKDADEDNLFDEL